MARYQQFIQLLNNIPKVCILPNMPMHGLRCLLAGVSAATGEMLSLLPATIRRQAAAGPLHRTMERNSGPAGLPT
jgi:hypothetical protein